MRFTSLWNAAQSFVSIAIRPLTRLPVCKRLAASTVLAMASNQNTKAQEAWRAMMLHTRTEIATNVDLVIANGSLLWDEFCAHEVDTRGPIELCKPIWFMTHFGWGKWLTRCRSWALLVKPRLEGQIIEYLDMLGRYHLLFKAREEVESVAFWINIKEARSLLNCYLNGWKQAISESAFEGFVVDHPQSWTTIQMVRDASFH
jgi:hypothetical protein